MASKISGLIITLNEEKNIEACIKSLYLVCDDIVIVDSYSIDNTVEIAEKLGAVVVEQVFLGDGPQRTKGLDYCKHNWVLNLDADERLEGDAVTMINDLDLEISEFDCYEFKRKNYLHGKWIKECGWYPDFIRRLFDKRKTDFLPISTHTKIKSTNLKKLNAHIVHYSFDNYQDMINMVNKYSSWQAKEYFNNNKKVSLFSPFAHGTMSFISHYLLKKGFLAGIDGFNISLIKAFGSYFKYMKLYEYYKYKT